MRAFSVICQVVALASGIIAMTGVQHAVAQGAGRCTATARNNAVVFVLCPLNLDQARWKEAGEAACAGREPCSAWIWDNALKIPAAAPPYADGIPKENILAAVAIWDNDGKQLVLVKQEKK